MDFLREAGSISGPEPFPSELLDGLRDLLGSDYANYSEMDRLRGRRLAYQACSRSRAAASAATLTSEDDYWRLTGEHPVCSYRDRTGDHSAHKLSDFLNHRQLRRLELYDVSFRPRRITDMISLGLPAPKSHVKRFAFERSRRDFGERERLLLNLLQPHFAQLHQAARDRRIAATLARHDQQARALIILSQGGKIEFANPPARTLLERYFDDGRGSDLPEPISRWLDQDTQRRNGRTPSSRAALTIKARTGRLQLRRVGDTILLDEDTSPLTPRERQITDLLAQGHSNAEIAAALWISPLTVRKHLENIYTKLGVPNRTAAVAHLHTR